MGSWKLFGICAVVLVVVWRVVVPGDSTPQKPNTSTQLTAGHALEMCRAGFRQFLRDPDRAKIPWRPADTTRGGFRFTWGRADGFRSPNGFGLDIPVEAVCHIDADKTFRDLVIGDRPIFLDGQLQAGG